MSLISVLLIIIVGILKYALQNICSYWVYTLLSQKEFSVWYNDDLLKRKDNFVLAEVLGLGFLAGLEKFLLPEKKKEPSPITLIHGRLLFNA